MKQKLYQERLSDIRTLLKGVDSPLSNYANVCSAIFHGMDDINWAGFYFLRDKQLLLGPFQGKPACTVIPLGKGVCGKAAQERQSLIVPDVHKFPGHIACDAASRSEVVIPMIRKGKLIGVLDVDSPVPDRFDKKDRCFLEEVVSILIRALDESDLCLPLEGL